MRIEPKSYIDSIADGIRSTHGAAWAPGLARYLAAQFWSSEGLGFSPNTYGTTRWVLCDVTAARDAAAELALPGAPAPIMIERLGAEVRHLYEDIGIEFEPRDLSSCDLDLVNQACGKLDVASGLFDTIVTLVRSIHIIIPRASGYDASHSDPALPFSIFISLPVGEPQAALRLAESILHEAMHLQLTLIEGHRPLIEDSDVTGYSPWRNEERPMLGLIHGLFVFRVIDHWLAYLVESYPNDEDVRLYASRRRSEISVEIESVSGVAGSPALTVFGSALARWLVDDKSRYTSPLEKI